MMSSRAAKMASFLLRLEFLLVVCSLQLRPALSGGQPNQPHNQPPSQHPNQPHNQPPNQPPNQHPNQHLNQPHNQPPNQHPNQHPNQPLHQPPRQHPRQPFRQAPAHPSGMVGNRPFRGHTGMPPRMRQWTAPPVTTTPAPTLPPGPRCSSQSQCMLGCCYDVEGNILWDHVVHSGKAKHKTGTCRVLKETKSEQGCNPLMCPCSEGMTCLSLPKQRAPSEEFLPGAEPVEMEGPAPKEPKCYTGSQVTAIKRWLANMNRIIFLCTMDILCPFGAALLS